MFNDFSDRQWGSDAIITLAELVMRARLPLSPFCRTLTIEALDAEYKKLNEWTEPEERRRVLDQFKSDLRAYLVDPAYQVG
jgi:hypothetical protein